MVMFAADLLSSLVAVVLIAALSIGGYLLLFFVADKLPTLFEIGWNIFFWPMMMADRLFPGNNDIPECPRCGETDDKKMFRQFSFVYLLFNIVGFIAMCGLLVFLLAASGISAHQAGALDVLGMLLVMCLWWWMCSFLIAVAGKLNNRRRIKHCMTCSWPDESSCTLQQIEQIKADRNKTPYQRYLEQQGRPPD